MAIEYETKNERVTDVLQDGEKIGVITKTPTGQVGYRLFGTHHGGTVNSEDEARQVIERQLA